MSKLFRLSMHSLCVSPFRLSGFAMLLALLWLGPPAAASTVLGRIEGNVTDPTGAKVAAARVMLSGAPGVIARRARTDEEGRFSISDLAPGRYLLMVEAPGLRQSSKLSIDVRAGGVETVDVQLGLSAISDQILVTATRTEVAASESGGSVTVVTGEDLSRAHFSLVTESLRLIPGLAVAQSGGRGGLTTIFARGGESDYNKVLIDGVPVNEAGGLFDFGALTTENIDRVEVVRGPRSALFGSDAMTSVIQLVTRRGSTAVPEFELSGEGGSFDYHRETARLSGLAGLFDYSASFGFQHTDGRFRNSDYTNRSASANLGFQISPASELRVSSRWTNDTLGVAGPTAALFADPDQRQKRRALALAAALDLKTTSRWRQTARFIYSEFNRHSFDPAAQDLTLPDTPPAGPFSFVDFALDLQEHQKRAGLHYQSVVAVTGANVITAGLDFERERAVFTDDFSGRVSPERNNLGLYVQDQVAWRERLFVTAGVRVERNRASVPGDLRLALVSLGSTAPAGDVGFGLSANPKVTLSATVRGHDASAGLGATRLRASFGTGIKEPEMHEAFSPNTFFLGNPDLDPERAISYDLGAAQEFFNRRASLEATYFDNRFRDIVIFISDPVTFGPVKLADGRLTNFINLDRASARGVEVVGAARPFLQLQVGAAYTFLRSRVERASGRLNPEVGLTLIRRPRHSGSIDVSWISRRFDLTLDGSFVGKRRDIDPVSGSRFDLSGRPVTNAGYAKLNAAGSYHIRSVVTLFARVENLLNQDYEEILGYQAYRLNFRAGVRLSLGGGR